MAYFSETSDFPVFPNDVPTAELHRLSIGKLLAGDTAESERLFDACTTTGFFLLHLQDDKCGSDLLEAVSPVFHVAQDLFNLDLDEKDQYSFKPGQPIFG